MGRTYQTLSFGQWDTLALWGQWPYWHILLVWEFVWWDASSQYLHHRHHGLQIIHLVLGYVFYRLLRRLCFTLWIGYYSGRKTTAIQLYLADLHCEDRAEHSALHWGWKLWDVISMRRADLDMELCVPTMFCVQKKVVQNTLYEPRRSWRATRLV